MSVGGTRLTGVGLDSPVARARATEFACRALDIAGALVLLVLLAPLLAAIALAIKLDSPGRVLFRQRRVGRDQGTFRLNKFRTMHEGAAHDLHRSFVTELIAGGGEPRRQADRALFKLVGDDRVTRVGRFLRRSSLDELPQLWNVMRGEMSLVGPRPPIAYEVEQYPARAFGRFAVKPGLTGLWQVSGRCETTFDEMIDLDLEYVRRRSLSANVAILVRTIPVVLLGRGAA
jgi:lipopolysaccharide/colanic/teichoic acid biosynthesis glycosyltransferase